MANIRDDHIMPRTFAILFMLWLPGLCSAQLMLARVPIKSPDIQIRVESKVPAGLGGDATLRFELLDVCFDGGSYVAVFKRDHGAEFKLFFPHPGYWSPDAKRDSKQPVAIHGNSLVEIAPESQLEKRILELIANDIVDGKRERDATLTLIRIRDCLLHRKPLAEIIEQYPADTWEPRHGTFSFEDDVLMKQNFRNKQTPARKHP